MPLEQKDGCCLTQESCADPFLSTVGFASLALTPLNIPALHEKEQEDPSVPWLPFLPCSLQGTPHKPRNRFCSSRATSSYKGTFTATCSPSGALLKGHTEDFSSEP